MELLAFKRLLGTKKRLSQKDCSNGIVGVQTTIRDENFFVLSNGIAGIQMTIRDEKNFIPKRPFEWNCWHSNNY